MKLERLGWIGGREERRRGAGERSERGMSRRGW
jgi:hypothetical protein